MRALCAGGGGPAGAERNDLAFPLILLSSRRFRRHPGAQVDKHAVRAPEKTQPLLFWVVVVVEEEVILVMAVQLSHQII